MCYALYVYCRAVKFLVICLAQLGVIFLLRKSDIAPDDRSDILFAFETFSSTNIANIPKDYIPTDTPVGLRMDEYLAKSGL